MNVNDAYQSKYLTVADLRGAAHQVTISAIEWIELGQGDDKTHKFLLTLAGKQKGFVANKTNTMIIAASYGDETNNWVGKVIELYPDNVSYQGKIVPAIRVRVPVPTAQPVAAPPVTEAPPAFDDDIPF